MAKVSKATDGATKAKAAKAAEVSAKSQAAESGEEAASQLPSLGQAACAVAIAVLAFSLQRWLQFAHPQGTPICSVVEEGSHVTVEFNLIRDEDGSVVDSSNDSGVLEFVCGDGEVLPAMDKGVMGLHVGDSTSFPFGGDAGFGARDEANVMEVDRSLLDDELEIGKFASVSAEGGERYAVVLRFNDTHATLDFNHPLAGLDLTMTVTVSSCTAPAAAPEVLVTTLQPGDGSTRPKVGDVVTIHYSGAFADSRNVFDSSEEKGAPLEIEIGAGQVIPGLEIGLQKLSLGEKAELHIPAKLAFAAKEARNAFQLNKDVVFEVEVVEISQRQADESIDAKDVDVGDVEVES
mmetsp:Transcript_54307/g.129414  ORF Transcript_54307/g.129414 Transcript_54307/m.129414 type:complete len:349 (-) Transcript_54307:7-1053(-)